MCSFVLGFYKGYKLHLFATEKDEIIPLAWKFSYANENDSQKIELLYRALVYKATTVVAGTGYDSEKWFKTADRLGTKFVAGINKRNMKKQTQCKKQAQSREYEVFRS